MKRGLSSFEAAAMVAELWVSIWYDCLSNIADSCNVFITLTGWQQWQGGVYIGVSECWVITTALVLQPITTYSYK